MINKSLESKTPFRELEKSFPARASGVFHQEAIRSKKLGLEVVHLVCGQLRRVKADKSYVIIKKITPSTEKFHQGQKFKLV
jgi:hypothetical protein